ncbi:Protein HEAT-STRESS-ASSOCIATED 32 [Glycine soja]
MLYVVRSHLRNNELLQKPFQRLLSSFAFRWKCFEENEDRPAKPRCFGVTEIRSPHYTLFSHNLLQDIFESVGDYVDGLKFSGGSHSMMPKATIKQAIDMAHQHDVYVSTGDWAEHMVSKSPSSFKEYVEEYKQLGFDTIELNVSSLEIPEETFLRFIRLVKSGGLKAKPHFQVKFNESDNSLCIYLHVPNQHKHKILVYHPFVSFSAEFVEDVNLLIRRAERCIEAGADMIMIDADDVSKHADNMRADIIAKIIGRLGIEKTMFEASNQRISEWFIKQYGPNVNLFIDHWNVVDVECLRGRNLGKNLASVLGSSDFLF